MYRKNRIAKAVSGIFFVGLSSTIATSAAYAADEEDKGNVERIEVTGSRIKRTDLETPVPVTVITRQDIKQTGAINVGDILKQSPVAIAASDQSNSTFSTTTVGLNTTALRNLGQERTLVLVNGRRFVSGVDPSTGYAVDLNAIPTALIERIEILKSASSAIYGSDAVAGVVNIITRKDFEGVEVDLQTGISDHSDREQNTVNITTGGNWSSGNAWVSVGYDKDNGLKSSDRNFSKYDQAIFLDDNGNEVVDNLFSSYPPQGRISYKDSGGKSHTVNADGTPYSGGFNRADYRQLVIPIERKYAAAGIYQNVTDNTKLWTELNWNSSKTINSTIEPTPLDIINNVWLKDRNGTGGMDVNSPLVPDALRQQLVAAGITNLNQVSAFVRRMVEFGPRSTDVTRDTVRVATGVNYSIDDNWEWDSYLTWGRTKQDQFDGGQINVERAATAMDVIDDGSGNLVCRNELARLQGCVPLNFFGAGTVSQAAVDYIRVPSKANGAAEQFVVATGITGELPLELPGGAMSMAAGIEHRLEKGSFNPGELAQTGASSTNAAEPTDGSIHTNDYYLEFVLPVIEKLELDLAARYSDHSIVGGQTTWNAGVEYSPVDNFKLRASAARAIRTPNISDLYAGRGENFATVVDPCNGITATTTGIVADNCRSIPAVAARIAAEGAFNLTQAEVQSTGGYQGGNPDVKEETAKTWSGGFIWQVMDGLSMTTDYYDIKVDDAISTTSRNVVLTRCFTSTDFSQNCNGNAIRDSNGVLTEVNTGTGNENNIKTRGLDVEATYTADMGPGAFKAELKWNHLFEYKQTPIGGGETTDYTGEVLYPRNRANLNLSYSFDDFSVAWRMRYWSHVVDSNDGSNLNFTDGNPLVKYNSIKAVWYHDLNATYALSDKTMFNVGIRNVFDKKPPVLNQSSNYGSTGINTAPEAYDVTGRYFFAGVNFKF
ncbi:TonB-dependent receptor [Gallaecimonas kandeliae]|uniref:TonB-dependent receptor domain-containing protein n=1 Tax=Gallaecimonas kandeliae TaxID=3029055 RepID=UPI0026494936|nr:TonB-dependent receptor [Gallaecimonas kandeliae]WKE64454.1 TonB-dependent receptor [Gallaecimonas kandeliae]